MKKAMQIFLVRLAAMYLRHTPLEYGRWRITNMTLPWLRAVGSGMGEIVVTTRWKFRFNCLMADWLSQYVYLTGTYERPTSNIIARLIRPGDIALDVGANTGYFSMLIGTLAGPDGHVYAFEPIPDVASDMQRNITLNNLNNITLTPVVVCNENSEQVIYEGPPDHRGVSSMRNLQNASQAHEVKGVRLDDYPLELEHLRLVKIDVEGAEQVALEGMPLIIEKHRPYIVIEFTDAFLRNFGHSSQTLTDWLVERDYHLYQITNDGLYALTPNDKKLPFQYNVLCSPTSSLPAELGPAL